ncbi:uncharacterized protein V6R79_003197 [Siganus canaliculatus]
MSVLLSLDSLDGHSNLKQHSLSPSVLSSNINRELRQRAAAEHSNSILIRGTPIKDDDHSRGLRGGAERGSTCNQWITTRKVKNKPRVIKRGRPVFQTSAPFNVRNMKRERK